MEFNIGDRIQMKKPHPCGSYEWEILRTGMDFRIKCMKCAHSLMLPRVKLEKGFQKFVARSQND